MRRKGFTLVELLVVIAIIGLLAGLIFPVVSKVQGQAKIRQCQANLKEMGTAFQLYNSIFQVMPPSIFGGKMKIAHLVACKRTGFGPKQCLCPVAVGKDSASVTHTVDATNGEDFVDNFQSDTVTVVTPKTASGPHISYGSRKKNKAIPVDAVDPSGTPLAVGNDACREGHGNVVNAVFLDGHVEQYSDSDSWCNDTNDRNPKLIGSLLDEDATVN